MSRTEWTPALARMIRRLTTPHVVVLGIAGECLACRIDGWANRARVAARFGFTYKPLQQIEVDERGTLRIRPATPARVQRA